MKYLAFFDPHRIYKSSIKPRITQITIISDQEYSRQRNNLIEFMWETGDKLKLSLSVIHLSIMFLDFVLNRAVICPSKYQIYAATAVMLAAKSSELDERIPFISKLKRYSNLTYKTEEFARAEMVFL